MSKRVSIKDIAELAGVSHSTVSRALHGRGRMSEETRMRIIALAEDVGYTPDALARGLVSGETRTIGVVVTTIADPFVVQIVDGIESVAQEAGYSVFLSASHNDPDREMAVVETFRQRRVDAVIVTASRVGALYADILEDFGAPIVLINNMHASKYLYSVSADDVSGAQMAVEYLLAKGHQRIAYIGSAERPLSSQRRWRGYLQAHKRFGIVPAAALRVEPLAETDREVGRMGLVELLDQAPSAIFTYNDMTAIGVMLEARARKVDIPRQLSLVGFDDIQATQFVMPALTTIHQPRAAMGKAAMEMALSLLHGKDASNISLACHLVERDSVSSYYGGDVMTDARQHEASLYV
ncbi:MAG TPA: LacI family transcriptional regulator [Caldilineae bacterium]|nr:LacI family transcriptional regulator [Caldilineae bacterium]